MKLTVVKEFTFEAAHYLPGYDGPCANMHGHTYRLQVGLTGHQHPQTGMVMDFTNIKVVVGNQILQYLDHQLINEANPPVPDFMRDMPTAENMVKWIAQRLERVWSTDLSLVRLYETPTSYAEWRRCDE